MRIIIIKIPIQTVVILEICVANINNPRVRVTFRQLQAIHRRMTGRVRLLYGHLATY